MSLLWLAARRSAKMPPACPVGVSRWPSKSTAMGATTFAVSGGSCWGESFVETSVSNHRASRWHGNAPRESGTKGAESAQRLATVIAGLSCCDKNKHMSYRPSKNVLLLIGVLVLAAAVRYYAEASYVSA
ncbi:MAG: hypothetical protein ACREJM_05475, partial [Candidatus Saccharimonadales bacterium]